MRHGFWVSLGLWSAALALVLVLMPLALPILAMLAALGLFALRWGQLQIVDKSPERQAAKSAPATRKPSQIQPAHRRARVTPRPVIGQGQAFAAQGRAPRA